ncbi:MAG: hypothetical protein ACI97P_000301 [Arcticibacterium sp.]|jgi:hypothetical protein
MKKKIYLLLTVCLGVLSCTEINTVIEPGDKPVIEAFLAPGQKVFMKIFTEIPYSFVEEDNVSEKITGLEIFINGDDGSSFNLIDKGAGLYESNETLGAIGTTYSMSFQYKGRKVSASTTIPPKPESFEMNTAEIERLERDFSGFVPWQGGGPGGQGGGLQQEDRTPLELIWSNTDGVYHFVAAQYLNEVQDPVVQFPVNESGFTRPPRTFNNEPVLTNTSNLQPQQFEYFGEYDIILYRLNPDYAALYENNNTSTQNVTTPVSTISNGLGIFTGVNADTLRLSVTKSSLQL